MSRNASSTSVKSPSKKVRNDDLRVRRTQQRLGSALVALMQEKPVKDIAVQEVLDRAGVGRSTFYVHFRDTDDLLLSQLEHFLEMMSTMLSKRGDRSHRVAPVAEMFAHVGEQKKMWRAIVDAGRLPDFLDLAQEYFSRGIEKRLKELEHGAEFSPPELTARSQALAGSLLSLLRWWLERGSRESPESMDATFHRIVWGPLRNPRADRR